MDLQLVLFDTAVIVPFPPIWYQVCVFNLTSLGHMTYLLPPHLIDVLDLGRSVPRSLAVPGICMVIIFDYCGWQESGYGFHPKWHKSLIG